jgi:hypothetical protein
MERPGTRGEGKAQGFPPVTASRLPRKVRQDYRAFLAFLGVLCALCGEMKFAYHACYEGVKEVAE